MLNEELRASHPHFSQKAAAVWTTLQPKWPYCYFPTGLRENFVSQFNFPPPQAELFGLQIENAMKFQTQNITSHSDSGNQEELESGDPFILQLKLHCSFNLVLEFSLLRVSEVKTSHFFHITSPKFPLTQNIHLSNSPLKTQSEITALQFLTTLLWTILHKIITPSK